MKKALLLLALSLVVIYTATAQVKSKRTFGKGIYFMAPDSSFDSKFNLRFQSLFTAERNLADGEDWTAEYLMRRARLKFAGKVYTQDLSYKVELGLTSRDIGTGKEDGNTGGASRVILDAVMKYKFSNNWAVWVGQTKLPGNRERVVSSANLQFVDRSLVNSKFNVDRDMGIQLHGKYKLDENFIIKPKFAWTMGEGRDIVRDKTKEGFNYTARLDILPTGEFKSKGDYVLADVYREEKPKVAFGVNVNYNQDAVRQQGQLNKFVTDTTTGEYANNDLIALQADMIFKYNGWSIFAEYANTTASENYGTDVVDNLYNTGSGINIQTGYIFNNNIEAAYRYTNIVPDDEDFSGIKETTQHTLCLSKYIVNHSLKIQTDFTLQDTGADNLDFIYRFQTEFQF